jgi:hypothetical protein
MTPVNHDYLETFGLGDDFVAAIGSVCVSWSTAEHAMNFVLQLFAPVNDLSVANCLISPIDISTKFGLAKSLARLRLTDHGKFETIEKVINILAHDLGPKRNRTVHDSFSTTTPGADILQLQFQPKIAKPQSNTPKELTVVREKRTSAKEIRELAHQIKDAAIALNHLGFAYITDCQDGPTPWPDISHLLPQNPNLPQCGS